MRALDSTPDWMRASSVGRNCSNAVRSEDLIQIRNELFCQGENSSFWDIFLGNYLTSSKGITVIFFCSLLDNLVSVCFNYPHNLHYFQINRHAHVVEKLWILFFSGNKSYLIRVLFQEKGVGRCFFCEEASGAILSFSIWSRLLFISPGGGVLGAMCQWGHRPNWVRFLI